MYNALMWPGQIGKKGFVSVGIGPLFMMNALVSLKIHQERGEMLDDALTRLYDTKKVWRPAETLAAKSIQKLQ